jgi:hypothetical protein
LCHILLRKGRANAEKVGGGLNQQYFYGLAPLYRDVYITLNVLAKLIWCNNAKRATGPRIMTRLLTRLGLAALLSYIALSLQKQRLGYGVLVPRPLFETVMTL